MRTETTGECRRALRTGPAGYQKHAARTGLTTTREDSWKARQLGKGLGERVENLKSNGRKQYCKQKIAGHGELVPFTIMNATQIQSQGPSVSRAELCSRFEQEERCHSKFHWIV